ncbi:MAG: hypothetical protein AB7L28_04255 [Kofleriaceae bacterium]
MAATIDPSALLPEPDLFSIGVLERNRSVQQRVARVIRSASGLEWVACADEPLALRAQLADAARLLVCDGSDVDLLLQWTRQRFVSAQILAWSHHPVETLVTPALQDDRIVSLIGWPTFQSIPRAWEIALATRTVLWPGPDHTTFADIFTGIPVVATLQPRTPDDRDQAMRQVSGLVERAGGADRTAARIGEVAHELIMNATFDAPVDARGEPRYAYDRREQVVLSDREVPTLQFATDGMLVALQMTDPFGRLTRDHVLSSIDRGKQAGRSSTSDVVDRSQGGAGLGFWRVYSSSAVTIVDVTPGHSTTVTAVFDVDVAPREARTMPPSLHLFDRGRLTVS